MNLDVNKEEMFVNIHGCLISIGVKKVQKNIEWLDK